jgi:hypothetical protein
VSGDIYNKCQVLSTITPVSITRIASASTGWSQPKTVIFLMTLVTTIPLSNTLSLLTCHIDKSLLHDGNSHVYEQGTPRFTLPPRSRERPVIPSSLLTNTLNYQQHPINALPVYGDMYTRFNPDREDPNPQSLILPKSTNFFHGTGESMQHQLEKQSLTPSNSTGTFPVNDTPGLLHNKLTMNGSTISIYPANS